MLDCLLGSIPHCADDRVVGLLSLQILGGDRFAKPVVLALRSRKGSDADTARYRHCVFAAQDLLDEQPSGGKQWVVPVEDDVNSFLCSIAKRAKPIRSFQMS